ncbi:hypothetical protein DP117_08005 [Brasilonema sp. UFV-L1]|nr:hypothetical protein [Brasilonema sp. UFV-L1]
MKENSKLKKLTFNKKSTALLQNILTNYQTVLPKMLVIAANYTVLIIDLGFDVIRGWYLL